ncbi:hypothetical protein SAMN05421688_1173 [Poseidonocella pacifica]|uniref:Uncharacterized protein n=1 Tax=Poseidonocella pacifica TaxID=871651 RepID=A0A1I0WAW0_9RHOB|nr:hypothetical protein SAMN05421688_1173 [Poseidonocella pacifica]
MSTDRALNFQPLRCNISHRACSYRFMWEQAGRTPNNYAKSRLLENPSVAALPHRAT